MKTIFIVNPCAGQGKDISKLLSEISRVSEQSKLDVEYYVTKSIGDATTYVKNYCENNGAARFIACGGDGTLNEVVNGAIGYEGTEVGVYPLGTGNDFRRNFPTECDFFDIHMQIHGATQKCDVIRYVTEIDDKKITGYCINMFNIGFDANVADMTSEIKKKPFISGSLAYFLSILINLIKKRGANLKIKVDDREIHTGRLLLTSIANGCYCGGGIKSNPLASVTDGLLNINIIRNISRIRFLTLLPGYMKGTFLSLKNVDRYITSIKCKSITICPASDMMRLCIDGEMTDAKKTVFEIVPKAVNFVIPLIKDTKNINNKKIIMK